MKDSYSEGLATRADSESCIFVRKGASEALTGVRAGQVWSREIEPPSRQRWPLWGADAVELSGRQDWRRRKREMPLDPARSETLSMGRNLRETFWTSLSGLGEERTERSLC